VASATEVAVGVAVELVIFGIAGGVLFRLYGAIFSAPKLQTVVAFQVGVILLKGSVERIVEPGRYWISPKRTLVLCDMRPRPFQLAAQDLLTIDMLLVRISVSGEYQITDPARFVTASTNGFDALFLDLKQALRVAVAEAEAETLFRGESPMTPRVRELLVPRSAHLGLEVTKLEVWEALPLGWQVGV
jgi:regulator of protease activity HflC (stomatin/prohibitin superfamily)